MRSKLCYQCHLDCHPTPQVTRFAGKAREMARMLRLKADLQRVVVSAEYGAQTFNNSTTADDVQTMLTWSVLTLHVASTQY